MKNTIITNTKRQLLMLCAALCCAVMWGANPTAPDMSAVNETSYQLTVNSGANGVTSVTYFVDSTDEIPETGDTRQYSVIEGVEVSFTFTPSSEYSVGSVTVDGVDVTASLQPGMTSPTVKTYTLAPMSADVTVQVTYAKNYTDGEVFTAQTIEGVNMDFKVISAADMTCQVGDGSHSSIAEGVTVVTVPSVVNGFTVTTVGSKAFWRGAFGALTTVTLPSTITSIGNNAFESCGALTAIVIPEAVTTIGDNAFLQCYDLASVTMPPTITYIGESAFKSTPSLTSIELPTSITTISAQAFYSSGLTSITIPEGVTSIGESAFNSCSSLATVNFPASLLTIGKGAFSLNSALTAINLPSQLQTIGESAFGNCELVTSITIPASVTTIESWGLSINNLKWVTVEGTTPPTITENSFSGGTTGYGVLYVQQDAIDTYHASEYWNVFNRIYAIGKHPYAVLDGNTLTFYCDDQREARTNPMELNFTSANNSPIYPHKDEITSVVFDDSFADFTELTSTANWFYDCGNLTSITGLEKVNTSKVTTMEYMFDGCRSLTSLDISNFDLSSVQTMSCMFRNCSGLTNINLGNFNASSTTSFSQMFQNCTSLETINISDANTSSATTMYAMFNGCRALTELNLGSFNTANVTNMSNMFANCNALKTIYVGSGWTTAAVTDNGTGMFSDCNNLEGGAGTTWASMAAAYVENCNNYQFAHIDGGTSNPGYLTDVADYGKVEEPYAVLSDENTKLTFYYDKHKEQNNGMDVNFTDNTLRGWNSSASYITEVVFDPSFANCTTLTSTAWLFWSMGNLTTITGIENLKTNHVTNMYSMFAYCPKLTSLDVSGFNTSKVTDMGYMFGGCSGLTTLDVRGFNTSNVTNMRNMFDSCSGLTSLDVSNFNTANVTNMYGMFMNCTGLTTLDLSSFNTAKVEVMENMFCQNTALTTISVDGTKWNTGAVTSSISMFYMCPNLVGGQGTVYDINRVDASYAHIDGGTSNPGYFTPKSGYVEAPTFAWNADELTMTSGTDGATIYYTLTDAVTSTPTPTQYTAPITVTSDVLIEAYAEKDGMARSMTTTLNYPYTAWKALVDAIADAQNVLAQANTNDNVTAEQRDSLVNFINTAQGMYEARIDSAAAITQFTTDLTTLTETVRQAVEAIAEPYAVLSDNGIFVDPETGDEITAKTLTFYYDKQKEARNGMDIGPFAYLEHGFGESQRPWHDVRESITDVVFDSSMANDTTLISTGWWFYGCTNLKRTSGWQYLPTANIVDMWGMFENCSSLSSNPVEGGPDFSAFNTASLKRTCYLFHGCTSMTSIDLSTFNTANVTETEGMFQDCAALTTIYVGSGWTMTNVSGNWVDDMFSGSTSLVGGAGTTYDASNIGVSYAHIDGGPDNPGYLTSNGDTPYVVASEAYAVLSEENTKLTFYYDNQKDGRTGTVMSLTSGIPAWHDNSYDIKVAEFAPSFVDYYPTSTAYWFSGCIHLTNINGIENLKTDSVTDMSRMFYMCRSLNTLDVSNFNTSNVTNMFSMFNDAWVLDLDVSNFNTAKVMNMGEMFMNCNQLHELNLSNFNTANVTDMHSMFNGCTGLTNLDLSSFNTSNVTDTWGMFLSCNSLTSLNVGSFNTAKVTKMDSMFGTCSLLSNLDVSNFDTSNVTSMYCMFNGCSSLTVLNLSSFNTEKVEIMTGMFQNAANLSTIYVGDGWTTSVVTSHENMFANCSSLVGGSGTTYDADHVGADYAHIDGGESSPGYFTAAGEEPFQESKNWSVVGTLAGSSESGVTMIAIDETNYTATFTLLPAGVYEYKVRDDNNIDRTYGQPDGSDVTVTVPEDNYNVTILFNAKTKAVSHELAEPIYSVIGFTSADGSGRSEFVMQRDSVGVPYTASTSVSMGTRTFKISINHEDSVYYGKKGQLKGEPIAFYTPMAGMNVTFYFDPVTKLATTSVGIIKDKYAVHVSVAGNGSVVATETDDTGTEQSSTIVNGTSEEDVEVTEDNTLTLTLQPADGNHLVSLIVDGVDVTSQIEDNKYMLPAIAETHTVSVTYVQNDLEPYAVLSEENTRLTFYYDSQKESRGGISFQSGTNVYWPSSITSVTTVSFDESFADFSPTSTSSWFAGFNSLTSIEGMEYLNTEHVTSMISMFQYCENLTSLDLRRLQTGHVETMTNMFYGCKRLGNLNLSGFSTANVTSLASMFYGCQSLTTIDLSSFNTSNVTRMEEMFQDCAGLTTLDLTNFNTENVENMTLMFAGCTNLATIYAGSGWSVAKAADSRQMFYDCTSLVGGQGTVYDAEYTDKTYAHIDGGTSNPGYLTLKLAKGDANGDGNINIADAVATVTNILGQPTEAAFYKYAADMNTDQVIDIFDVTLIVNAAFDAASPAPAMTRGSADNIMMEHISMTADANYIYLGIDQPERFTATQFDVTLPEGMELVDARLASATTDHQLSFVKRGNNEYRVIGLSMSNTTFRSMNGQLIKLEVSGSAVDSDVKMSNVLFVTPTATVMTSIDKCLNTAKAADDSLYDLKGQRLSKQQLGKGIYIMNHKKVIIK